MNIIKANNLFLIPARKGSKGIPKKNTKLLKGTPLISYTFEYVSKVLTAEDKVCVSTDDEEVIKLAESYNFKIIKRPTELAGDNSSMDEVIKHVLENYKSLNISFNAIVILQPTSPNRILDDFFNIKKLFNPTIDMVVSVCKARENPYYLLYEENDNGFIFKSKNLAISRRQDSPKVYRLNGSFFIINPNSINNKKIIELDKILKHEMPYERSIDIDDQFDWDLAEFFIEKKFKSDNENNF